jgi:alanine dehydrogenase
MRIGVPKEIKVHEYRVAMTPAGVREVVARGSEVVIEAGAGEGSGFADAAYQKVGAVVADTAEEVFATADMVVKVKEPQPVECRRLREKQILFAYLHLAPDPEQARLLCDSGCSAIAFETVTDSRGGLPLLAPMSEVAGRMSVQVGAAALEKSNGGRGVLLSGVPGVPPAKVLVIGGGVAGSNAARIASGMGADVTVLDTSLQQLRRIDDISGGRFRTCYATAHALGEHVKEADLVIGAVLVPGATAPKLVTRCQLSDMKQGAVLVDVAIDQGGCFETSRATSHANPTFVVDGIVHYCVANMPGAVSHTSTLALSNATLPFILQLAGKGMQSALADDPHLAAGLNIRAGRITHPAVAQALGATEFTRRLVA